MGARVGIELSPIACRLVELEGPPVAPGQPSETRVLSYAVLPPSGPETDRRLAALGRRPATVVVWGVRNDHRQVVVSSGSYEKMRTEALASARSAGVDTRGALADVATASTAIKGAKRQPVVLALASAEDVSTAVRPLRDAGVQIRSVITPADALLGLARSRQAFAVPGGIEAYVALDETATCVALVRDGSLLSARELPWGYADRAGALSATADLSRRDDLAERLIDELTEFLTTVGAYDSTVAQVSICGGLPELRSMTIPLMERLDVEVEALDSLFGIDVGHLPPPAHEFREQASALRLAWAAAADWRGPIDLMRHHRRRNRRVAVARAAVVAGIAAGLGTGWAIQQSDWWQATTVQPVATGTPPATPVTSTARGNATPRAGTPNVPAPTAAAPAAAPAAPAAASPVIAAPPATSNATVSARPPTLAPPVAAATTRGTTPAASTMPVPPPAKPPAAPPPTVRPAPPAAATPPGAPVTTAASPPPVVPVTPPAATPPAPSARQPVPAAPSSVVRAAPPAAPPAVRKPPPVAPPPVVRATPPTTPPPVVRTPPPAASARQPVPAAPSPVAPPIVRSTPREQPAPATLAAAPAGAAPSAPRPVAAPSPAANAPAQPGAAGGASASRPAQPATRRPPETAVPFEAVLGTILYSPDRKLAIVNNRIVGLGDTVNGARIVDITPGTVLLRDPQGRLRSLTLGAVGGSGAAP